MTQSLVLTVNVDRADVNDYVRSSTDPRGEMTVLSTLFSRLAAGTISGSVVAQKAAVASVAASGTYTVTNASVSANDTIACCGITMTAKASGATGAQFNIGLNATATAANIAALINSLATLNIYVRATSALGVVTVRANQAGVVGNLIALATSNATGIAVSAATLAGGTGGAVVGATTYSRGL